VPRVMEFDGNLAELTARIRLHPETARDLRVLELVRVMRAKWAREPDPVEACDEFPGTAWVVRRKVEMVLPRPPREEASPVEAPAADRTWVEPAVESLRHLFAAASAYHFRPPGPRRVTRSVSGASAARLVAAWPRVRPRPAPPMVRVAAEADPITDRIGRWRTLLRAGPVRFPWPDEPRSEVVGMFVALLGLWASGEVVVRQEQPYALLDVERREGTHERQS
jgi:hypothetical protein